MTVVRPKLRIGTRGSALARWQANWVAEALLAQGIATETIHITTQGDVTAGPLGAVGTTGLFTKEIQCALLERRIDIAVHSLKDLPTERIAGLNLATVPQRADIADVFISNRFGSLDELPERARVGTGSTRREAQLRYLRPDLNICDIRGNVETRLRKLDDNEFDAIILAKAGLVRLGLAARITTLLGPPILFPAVGQGALGIETREDDVQTSMQVQVLDHALDHAAVLAERAMLRELRGGCLAPVGVWSRCHGDELELQGMVLSPDGSRRIMARQQGPISEPEELGQHVALDLVREGALDLIRDARKT